MAVKLRPTELSESPVRGYLQSARPVLVRFAEESLETNAVPEGVEAYQILSITVAPVFWQD
jgi:hypothetical protein